MFISSSDFSSSESVEHDDAGFESLKVWHKAHQGRSTLYKATRNLPVDERFGLISQIRRASASID